MGETTASRLERRQEKNRASARRHYYKSRVRATDAPQLIGPEADHPGVSALRLIQELQTQARALEEELDSRRFHASATSPKIGASLDRLQRLQTTRNALVRENTALRECRDKYVEWESALDQQVDRYLKTKGETATGPDAPKSPQTHRRWTLIEPLTLDECHAMTRSMYNEIKAFRQGELSIPPVLGWAHTRQEEDGRFKFSLQMVFPNRTAFELMKRSWDILGGPEFKRLYSDQMNIRCELVQQIDPSNVVQYLEYEVNGVDPRTGEGVLTVGRILAFQTIFETESGYITIFAPWTRTSWPIGPRPAIRFLPKRTYITRQPQASHGPCLSMPGRQATTARRLLWVTYGARPRARPGPSKCC